MASELPYVGFGTDDNDNKIGVIGSDTFTSLASMLAALADFGEPALPIAEALNHFDENGDAFSVIDDPSGYEAAYLKQFADEEGLPWDQFQTHLSDYEFPDFTQLSLPAISGDDITFYANHIAADTPYRVTGPASGGAALVYEPI